MGQPNLTVTEDTKHARIQLVVDGEADYAITGTIKTQAVSSLHPAGMYSIIVHSHYYVIGCTYILVPSLPPSCDCW